MPKKVQIEVHLLNLIALREIQKRLGHTIDLTKLANTAIRKGLPETRRMFK